MVYFYYDLIQKGGAFTLVYDNDINENNQTDEVQIRGKALYFSTSQVANVLNQPDSKIRYYTNVFDEILNIEVSNKQRRYTEQDIDKLRFLIELKQEGMTIKQIQEYCQQVDFENSKDIQIKETNPLSIKGMAKALLEEQAKLISEMQQEIIKQQQAMIDDLNERLLEREEQLKESISITVDDVISEKINEMNKNIDDKLDSIQKEVAVTRELNEKMDIIKNNMEERKKENQLKINTEKQSFLSKLFKR